MMSFTQFKILKILQLLLNGELKMKDFIDAHKNIHDPWGFVLYIQFNYTPTYFNCIFN